MAVFLLNICKFNKCGLEFSSLIELIQHIEDNHIGKFVNNNDNNRAVICARVCREDGKAKLQKYQTIVLALIPIKLALAFV